MSNLTNNKCAKCANKAAWLGHCRPCAREILHEVGDLTPTSTHNRALFCTCEGFDYTAPASHAITVHELCQDPVRGYSQALDVSKHTEFLRRWLAENPHVKRILIRAPLTHGRTLVSWPARHRE